MRSSAETPSPLNEGDIVQIVWDKPINLGQKGIVTRTAAGGLTTVELNNKRGCIFVAESELSLLMRRPADPKISLQEYLKIA